jgi:beta-glucanase (GH16 family)
MIINPFVLGQTPSFSDDFDGVALDTNKWLAVPPANENGGHAYEPGELQANIADAITVSGGVMAITARRVSPQVNGLDYTSGSPSTYGIESQAFGRWKFRCKPTGHSGGWDAGWLYPADSHLTQGNNLVPEIDVFEIFGNAPNQLIVGHRAYDGVWERVVIDVGFDLSQDYHIFEAVKGVDLIEWFLDGVSIYTATVNIGSQPMYTIVQHSLGGSAGTVDEAALPSSLLTDYVRIYPTQEAFTPVHGSPWLLMDVDASALANDAAVSSAKESAGYILTGTQATSGKRPANKTNVLNGHAGFLFDGVNDVLNTPSAPHNIGTGDFVYAAVVQCSDVSGGNYKCIAGRGFSPGFYIYNGHPHVYWGGDLAFSTVLASNTPYLLWWERIAGVLYCRVNGVLDSTTHSISSNWANGPLNIGDDGSSPFNGYLFYQLGFNYSFNTSGRQQDEQWLSGHFGFF